MNTGLDRTALHTPLYSISRAYVVGSSLETYRGDATQPLTAIADQGMAVSQ